MISYLLQPAARCLGGTTFIMICLIPGLVWGQTTPGDDLGLAGDNEVLWIYQRSWPPDGEQALLSFGLRPAKRDSFLGPAAMRGLVGEVHLIAVANGNLHVIYHEGSHRRYHYDSKQQKIQSHHRSEDSLQVRVGVTSNCYLKFINKTVGSSQ